MQKSSQKKPKIPTPVVRDRNRKQGEIHPQVGYNHAPENTTNPMNNSTAAVADEPAVAADAEHLLQSATSLVRDDLDAVNHAIRQRLDSDIALIRTIGAHLINSGGKRLRPLILLLSAKASGYRGNHHIILAAVIEFIHTATLLHDDVVDASAMRRGQATANQVWGNEASVLVGDFLYSRSFEMMLETDSTEVMRVLAATTNAIAEGEVMQLLNTRSPDTTEQAYLDTIHRKTAKLFESAARLGAVISKREPSEHAALAAYGIHLGTAFQLIDDILDYSADSETIGKNAGDDLAEGKPTLPLIHALRHGTRKQQQTVRHAIENGARESIGTILAIVESTGALAYTAGQAKLQATAAIEALAGIGESRYKEALINLAEFSVKRDH